MNATKLMKYTAARNKTKLKKVIFARFLELLLLRELQSKGGFLRHEVGSLLAFPY